MTSLIRSMLAVFALLVVAAPAATASVPAMRFSIRPQPGGSLSDGGDYFVMDLRPGAVGREAIELSNPTERPVTVRLAAVDAATAQLGGVDYSPSGAPPERVGAWIDLGRASVKIAAGAVEVVPFEIVVPEDATSGINLAGIAAWTPAPGRDRGEAEGVATAVEVQTRRVVAVQVELPGTQDPLLEIEGVSAVVRSDGIYLQVDIRNDGHGFAQGEGIIELEGDGFSQTFLLDKVVPGTTVGYPIRWRDHAPDDGSYPASVEIDYTTAVAAWDGEVLVGDALRGELADRGIDIETAFPVMPVAGAAVLAGALAALWVRRRKSRRSPAPAPKVPDPAIVSATNLVGHADARGILALSTRPGGPGSPPPPPPPPSLLR